MKKLLVGISAVFAAIPGISVLAKGFLAPPGSEALFGWVLEVFGVAVFLLLFVNRRSLTATPKPRITKWSLALMAIVLVSVIAYTGLFHWCVVTPTRIDWLDFGAVYFPLWLSGDAAQNVAEEGSRVAAVNTYGPVAVVKQLGSMPGGDFARITTTTVLLLLYTLLVVSLTALFAILGLHEEPKG